MSEETTTDDVQMGSRPSLVSTRAAHLSPKLQRRGSSSARKFESHQKMSGVWQCESRKTKLLPAFSFHLCYFPVLLVIF
ncbi:hypothetical protein CAEBREN_10252 [Caenorhabditis brenneri]|uniref:Uncharacterized protein n=1 Tax=Caenorhabditis brenneri TaxID=135651 RepID=G0MXW5_CAEBE|nr:hypothetical protein CAEBREN_10252 [Caenorhabditis brenneri]